MRSYRNAVHPLFRIYPTTAVRSMARASIKNVPMTFAWNSRPSDCEFESDSCSLHSITSNGRSNLVLNQNAVLGFVVFYTSPCEFWYFCCRLWEKKVEKNGRFLAVMTKTSMRSKFEHASALCIKRCVLCEGPPTSKVASPHVTSSEWRSWGVTSANLLKVWE